MFRKLSYIPFDKWFAKPSISSRFLAGSGLQRNGFSLSHARQSRATESAATDPDVLTGNDGGCRPYVPRTDKSCVFGFCFSSHLSSVGSQVATERSETTHQMH